MVTVNGSNIWEEQQYIRESDLLEEFLEELIELYSTLRQRSENDHIVIEEIRYIDDGYKLRVRGNDSFTRITKEHKVPLFYYLAQFTNVDVQ